MRTEYRYGERTRDLRAQRGWTQEHFAEVARIDVRTVQRLERDRTAGAEAVLAVAVAFGVEVKEQVETALDRQRIKSEDQRLWLGVPGAPAPDQVRRERVRKEVATPGPGHGQASEIPAAAGGENQPLAPVEGTVDSTGVQP